MSSEICWLSSSSPFWTGLCSSMWSITELHLRQLNTCIFFPSASRPDLRCLLQLITFFLEQLLPSHTSNQDYCKLCKHQNHANVQVKLVVQAQPFALYHTLECPCITLVRHTSLLGRVVLLLCNDNLNRILRNSKNTVALGPRISARDMQIKTAFQKAGNE